MTRAQQAASRRSRRALLVLTTMLTAWLAPPRLWAATVVADAAAIAGEWWTPGFNARVRIEPCGDAVCGRIVWLWNETPKDVADKRPLLDRVVIDRMREAEPGRWVGGRLYNPEDARDYKGSLQLQSASQLRVDGCVLFICQTQVWRRADAGRCPPVAAP